MVLTRRLEGHLKVEILNMALRLRPMECLIRSVESDAFPDVVNTELFPSIQLRDEIKSSSWDHTQPVLFQSCPK